MASADKVAKDKEQNEAEVLAAIAAMPADDRALGERLHAIITENAPNLFPRTWYGMPAYTDGNKIYCFFRSKKKFGERFVTFGFNDVARLDEGNMWPIYFAIKDPSKADEEKIAELVKKSVS